MKNIDIEYIRKNKNKVNWKILCETCSFVFLEVFIKEFSDYFNYNQWYFITKNSELSEEFLEEFQDKICWVTVSSTYDLSQNFIDKFEHKIHWDMLSMLKELTEDFMRENEERINWINISACQNLSEKFIYEFREKVHWPAILNNQKISDLFLIDTYEYHKNIKSHYFPCYNPTKKTNYSYFSLNMKNIEYTLFQSKLGRSLLVL